MGNLKPLPAGAEALVSVQAFQKNCQAQRPESPIDWSQALVSNRLDGDGKFQILLNDPEKDFYCATEMNWLSHEMSMVHGRLSETKQKAPTPLEPLEMPDACSAARQLAGPEEPAGQSCADGVVEPKIGVAEKFQSVQRFRDACSELIGKGKRFDLQRLRIFNELEKDGTFNLLYESRKNNFFCEGLVDTNSHRILLRHGPMLAKEQAVPDRAIEMVDACSLTTALFGAAELVGECKDKTAGERNWEHYLSLGFYGGMSALTLYQLGKWALKFSRSTAPWALGTKSLMKNAPSAFLAGFLFNKATGLFLPEDHPVRAYGTLASGAAGLLAPQILKRTLGQRLVSGSLLQRSGALWGRAAAGAFLVAGIDFGLGFIGSDYRKSVDARVADRIYDQHVYRLDWWDLTVLPLAVKGLRAGCRALAPNAMNWAIATDHEEVKQQVLAEDRQGSEDRLAMMKEIFSAMDGESLEVRNAFKNQLAKALIEGVQLTPEEGLRWLKLQFINPEKWQEQTGLDHEQLGEFYQKMMVKRIQDAAQFMIKVDQDTAIQIWARQVFNPDGTLIPGQEYSFAEKLTL